MTEKKKYDLEERTFNFARDVRSFVQSIPRSNLFQDDINQVIRSSGSIGANYIEANESLGKKDFGMRIRICRKEAKETVYWLQLISGQILTPGMQSTRAKLEQEAKELMHIFGAIVSKIL